MNIFRLGIKARLYGGFGLLVAFAVALAAFAVVEFSTIDNSVRKLGALADNTVRALDVTHALEVVRRNILHYRLDGNEEQLKEGTEAAGHAAEILQAAAKATLSEDRRRIYGGLEA